MATATVKISSIINPDKCIYKVRWGREGEILGESSQLLPRYLADYLARYAADAYPNLDFEVFMPAGDGDGT